MIIDLDSVGKIAKHIVMAFDPAEIDLEGEDARLTGPAEIIGETQRVDGKAHIRGTIGADVLIGCTRCLEPFAQRIEASFDDIFVDTSEDLNAVESELGVDDLVEELVPDGKIDMAEVVREQLLLALPSQVLCREDCKGLCPKCGANRNLIDCKCADDEIDPRWAVLKGLK